MPSMMPALREETKQYQSAGNAERKLPTFRAEAKACAEDSMRIQTLAGCIHIERVALGLDKLYQCLGHLGQLACICHEQLAWGRCVSSTQHNKQTDGHHMQMLTAESWGLTGLLSCVMHCREDFGKCNILQCSGLYT